MLIFGVAGIALAGIADLYLNQSYSDSVVTARIRRCSSCEAIPQPWQLLPIIGYLRSRGRCPQCSQPLPWRALALPPAMALLFVLAWLTADSAREAWVDAVLGAVLLLLLVTDMERRLIPNRIVYPALPLALALSFVQPEVGPLSALAGGGVLFAFMLAMFIISRGGLGAGDVKMAALVGVSTGLPDALVAMVVGAFLGGMVAVVLLVTRRVRLRQSIPYGPFLALGGVIALLWGSNIVEWYRG